MNNLYWNVYKSLERELLTLAEVIHIDDTQLGVYSMKIADLLIRTSVEIESISKELYFREGGTKPNDNELYFDTDCLDLLESKWSLSKKVIMVSSPEFYFKDSGNIYLKPLHKAHKRGSSSSDWKKAYQAVKHNRAASFDKGNIKHFIRSLAALYLLNLYYKDQCYPLGRDQKGDTFDAHIGSMIFSVMVHPFPGVNVDGKYNRNIDFDSCVYLLNATKETYAPAQKAIADINAIVIENALKIIETEVATIEPQETIVYVQERLKALTTGDAVAEIIKNNQHILSKPMLRLEMEAVLNKNQL